jgi:hypothetical protein
MRTKIRTTIAEHFGTINAANLKGAHALLEPFCHAQLFEITHGPKGTFPI